MRSDQSIHRKITGVVLATTVIALVMTGAAMVFVDIRSYREALIADITAQADIVGLAAAPALEFRDPQSAHDYLALLAAKPEIAAAAIYTATGSKFATYRAPDWETMEFPVLPEADGHSVGGGAIDLYKRIVSGQEILGTVYIKAEYRILTRIGNFSAVVALVVLLSLAGAAAIANRLQRHITEPIIALTTAAEHVVKDRDFGSRATKTSDDEIGVLVDAFNAMLTEIESRTAGLEQKNRELQHEIAERARAESALQESEGRLLELNAGLEQRVAARTAELETANKDLEAFSYSVSHDLRAPIRAVHGFSTLLVEDHGDALDEEARRKLKIIGSEATRMGQLIDDLLAFSRLGRRALTPVDLDMAELAKRVFERLADAAPANLELKLGSLPHARGDMSLIEQVWVNLLSNAIKFSAKNPNPVIEVGGLTKDSEHIYFVRDNGAGFDAKHKNKLFGVFQRLHTNEEFSGTGVGLALVQRIITRHGGRVWADGELGKGATFHFTLPTEAADGGI